MNGTPMVLRFHDSPSIHQWLEWYKHYSSKDVYIRQENRVAYNQCFPKFITFLLTMTPDKQISLFIEEDDDETMIHDIKQIFHNCLENLEVNSHVNRSYMNKGFSFSM
ncbi:hypothetical protein U0355_08515 [Salimicrobium sp. PL1-032A]|uniref:hypothetical protein n=1 Tax=Salimicrobium sp. PL1-032A TaxID=3095364 RepID=UPI0032609CC9